MSNRFKCTAVIGFLCLILTGCSSLTVSDRSFPPLWKLEHPEQRGNVWLYSTVHSLPYGKAPSIRFTQRRGPSRLLLPISKPEWVSNELNQVLRRIDLLVLELDYSRDPVTNNNRKPPMKVDDFIDEKQNLTPLFSYLDEEEKQYVLNAAEQRNLPIEQLEKLSPPSALFMFSVLPRRDSDLHKLGGVEDWLLSYARVSRTPLGGLETPGLRLEAIVSAMQSVDREKQHQIVLDYLGSSIEEADDPIQELEELYQVWTSGDLTNVERQREAFAQYYPEIYEAFLGYRNRAWIQPIIDQVNSGKDVLIAVGQGHLIGPDNIRQLLRKEGYRVLRLQ